MQKQKWKPWKMRLQVNVQSNYRLKNISKNKTNIQEANGLSTAPSTTRTISCKARNPPIEDRSWQYKVDI